MLTVTIMVARNARIGVLFVMWSLYKWSWLSIIVNIWVNDRYWWEFHWEITSGMIFLVVIMYNYVTIIAPKHILKWLYMCIFSVYDAVLWVWCDYFCLIKCWIVWLCCFCIFAFVVYTCIMCFRLFNNSQKKWTFENFELTTIEFIDNRLNN